MNKMRFNVLLKHWKHCRHNFILGHKAPNSIFVSLNSRNKVWMNASNLFSNNPFSPNQPIKKKLTLTTGNIKYKSIMNEVESFLQQQSTSLMIFWYEGAKHKPLQKWPGQIKHNIVSNEIIASLNLHQTYFSG